MSVFTVHPRTRWALPLLAVAAIGGGTVLTSHVASADSGLPPLTAQQLLVDVQQAARSTSGPTGFSGTVTQTVDLGLPALPTLASGSGASGSGTSSLSSVVSGTHTWRIWSAGPTQQRLALLGDLGESDVVRNGSDLWLWSSQDHTAVHTTLPARGSLPGSAATARPLPTDVPRTPAEAAALALASIDPTTAVTTTGTDVVAGRPAYTLVLTPRDASTTRVAQVRLAIDSATKAPLRVQVFSTKLANPAIDVGFTSVDFSTPPASRFAFTPPPGTTVTQKTIPTLTPGRLGTKPTLPTGSAVPTVVGTGWSSVVVATLPAGAASALTGQAGALLKAIPTVSGAWGSGRLVDGTLFSAVLADDGRVAIGAVPPAQLYAALAAH